MTKAHLQTQIKSTSTAYLMMFFLGAHYAYLGRWPLQILFWITAGGAGIWFLIDLFTMSSKVAKHNAVIFSQMEEIDDKKRQQDVTMVAAAFNSKQ